MKTFAFFLFSVVLFSGSAFAQRSAAKPDPAKQVLAAFETLLEGIRTNDAEKVMSVYEKTDRVLAFNNNGTATIGWQNMKNNRDSLYEKTANVTLETTGVRVELLSATSAYVSCKWKQTQDFEGKSESSSGRMTLVFKRVGSDWKIVHAHTSPDVPPADRPVLPSERERLVVGEPEPAGETEKPL